MYIHKALDATGTEKEGDRLTLDSGDTTMVVRVMTEMKQIVDLIPNGEEML